MFLPFGCSAGRSNHKFEITKIPPLKYAILWKPRKATRPKKETIKNGKLIISCGRRGQYYKYVYLYVGQNYPKIYLSIILNYC